MATHAEAARLALHAEFAARRRQSAQGIVRDRSWFPEDELAVDEELAARFRDRCVELTFVGPGGQHALQWRGGQSLKHRLREVADELELDILDIDSLQVLHNSEVLDTSLDISKFPEWLACGAATLHLDIIYTPREEYERQRRTQQSAQDSANQRESQFFEAPWDDMAKLTYDSRRQSAEFAIQVADQRDSKFSEAPWDDAARFSYDCRRQSVEFAIQASSDREARLQALVTDAPGICNGSRPKAEHEPPPDASWWDRYRPRPAEVRIPPARGCPGRPPRLPMKQRTKEISVWEQLTTEVQMAIVAEHFQRKSEGCDGKECTLSVLDASWTGTCNNVRDNAWALAALLASSKADMLSPHGSLTASLIYP